MNNRNQFDQGSHGQVFVRGMVEDRASRSRGKHDGESSHALCDRLSRTRELSQRQLPTDHDYAVSTREYQTDPEAASIPTPKRWPVCTSYKLYSGIGTPVDFAAARRCAWSERLAANAGLAPKNTLEGLFGGSAMLTVLYANGEGAERNIQLALRFACEANFDGNFNQVKNRLLMPDKKQSKFVLCDEAETEFSIGFCAAYQQEIDDNERRDEYRKLSSQWPSAHRAAFEELLRTEANYAKAHATGETDLSG